jgi:C4-dicarboxylate transporter, DctM subunit
MTSSSRSGWTRFENGFMVAILAATALLPFLELTGRLTIGRGIPGSAPLVQNLTLWIAFLGAALAARSGSLLALSTPDLLSERWRPRARIFTSALAAAITVWLALASLSVVRSSFAVGEEVALGIPRWVAMLAIPLGLSLVAGRLIRGAAEHWTGRLLASAGLLFPIGCTWWLPPGSWDLAAPAIPIVLLGTILGMPIFAALAGAALVLFWSDAFDPFTVVVEARRMTDSAYLPAIPLFTLGGYILAEGGAGRRLMQAFNALLGWMPGGLTIAVTLILAFFTPLTGASGVTILAMGGLLLPMLTNAGYPERSGVGLVTVSGSIGLLLPPSLPVILYAVYGSGENRVVRIDHLFIGALVPGILLIVAVAGWAAFRGWSAGTKRTRFSTATAASAVWRAKWELLLPFVLLGGYFWGYFASLVEASAFTVAYALVVECVVYRELRPGTDIVRIAVEAAALVGSFFIILGAALGFNNYLLTALIPRAVVGWVESHIASPILFLLALNILLIIVGALMDIYSAIFVIAPLIAPMAVVYGIDPVHLGVIFLANMELGYLMPPMGENLFLSAMRFEKPLSEIYVSTLPYIVILFITVMLITYIPSLTLWPVSLLGR